MCMKCGCGKKKGEKGYGLGPMGKGAKGVAKKPVKKPMKRGMK